VLTNADDTGAFLRAVRRRLFELLFDGTPQAVEDLAAALEGQKKDRQELAERIKAQTDRAWLASVVSEYTNPTLGRLSVKMTGTDLAPAAVLDAGEWQSPVVQKVDLDGTVNLMTTAPGMQLQFAIGARTLTLKTAQQNYVFEAALGGAELISDDEGLMMCAEALPRQLACKEDFCAAMVKMMRRTVAGGR
jgi:hypothetical protein